jgi:hypothetical protein
MFFLYTDFGFDGPYVGQMKSVLHHQAPGVPVVDLMHDVPAFDIASAAYLLPAIVSSLPVESILLCVIDPGVGSARRPLTIKADGRWYVGPDNGLFDQVCQRATEVSCYEIIWQPEKLSASFHGRDLFAPVAAMIASDGGDSRYLKPIGVPAQKFTSPELFQVIYIDHYGNAMTGVRASAFTGDEIISVNGHHLSHARTFSEAAEGQGFWYQNSSGLVELVVNQRGADEVLGLRVGNRFTIAS